jgi:hypothetical protein
MNFPKIISYMSYINFLLLLRDSPVGLDLILLLVDERPKVNSFTKLEIRHEQ